MRKKLAVAVIHGMGDLPKADPMASGSLSFSAPLHDRVRGEVPGFEAVAWREIFWSDILQPRQHAYVDAMRKVSSFGWLRGFVMHRLADAASYYPSMDADSTYGEIHFRVARAMADLEADVPPGTPLLLLAHSLGGHILSNYIYDIGKGRVARPTPFQRMESFAGLVTFGCNIPVFIFAVSRVEAIRHPGQSRPLMPWWRNYYAPADPLGYPLEPIGGDYAAMAAGGELVDRRMRVGFPLLVSRTALSHGAYWRDRRFAGEIAAVIREILDQE